MMPKKKNELSQSEQSKRFLDAAQELVDAGELSPTEADERFEKAVQKIAQQFHKPTGHSS